MNKSKKTNFVFYIFWASVLLFGSIIAIFIFYKTNPIFVEEFLLNRSRMSKSEEFTSNNMPNDTLDNISNNMPDDTNTNIEKNINNTNSSVPEKSTSPSTNTENIQKTNDNVTKITPPIPDPIEYTGDPLFRNVKLDRTSSFLSKNGTTYFAGSLTVVGFYPDAFDGLLEHSNNLYSSVSVTLSVGWKTLPSFSQIKTSLYNTSAESSLTKSLSIPSLQILSIKTDFADSIAQKQAATRVIENYLKNVFLQRAIPTRIISLAQQRLASSYIQKGYQNIILRTQ